MVMENHFLQAKHGWRRRGCSGWPAVLTFIPQFIFSRHLCTQCGSISWQFCASLWKAQMDKHWTETSWWALTFNFFVQSVFTLSYPPLNQAPYWLLGRGDSQFHLSAYLWSDIILLLKWRSTIFILLTNQHPTRNREINRISWGWRNRYRQVCGNELCSDMDLMLSMKSTLIRPWN